MTNESLFYCFYRILINIIRSKLRTPHHSGLSSWESSRLLKDSVCVEKSVLAINEKHTLKVNRGRVRQGCNLPDHQAEVNALQHQAAAGLLHGIDL